MPYESNQELPERVQTASSEACQTIFRNAFNSIEEENPGISESELFQRAWGAMQNSCSRSSESEQFTRDQSQNMKLETISNEMEPRTEKDGGKEYVVAPVRFIKNMDLNFGYVPERHIREATNDWEGTPIVADHPKKNGRFVSVNSSSSSQNIIGEIRNPQSIITNDTVTMGEIWISPSDVKTDEEKEVLKKIRNGDTLSVSSAYKAEKLKPGDYDGEYREEVRGNLVPDHVAVFANKEGRCSVGDGCFAGPNADKADHEVVVNISDDSGNADEDNVAGNQRRVAREPTFQGVSTDDWEDPEFEEYVSAIGTTANSVPDLSSDQKTEIAEMSLLGSANAETFEELVFFPVVEPETRELSLQALNSVLGEQETQVNISQSSLESARGMAERLAEENFENSGNSGFGFMEKLSKLANSLIIRNNKAMTKRQILSNDHGFEEENLPEEGTECLDRIYEKFAANEEEQESKGSDESEGTEATEDEPEEKETGENDDDMNEDIVEKTAEKVAEQMSDRFVSKEEVEGEPLTTENVGEAVAEAIAANEKRQEKEELADTLISNGEYEEEDREELMDYPKKALKDLVEKVDAGGSANFAFRRGAEAQMSSNEVDGSAWGDSPVATDAIEGDD